jgi:DNA-binding FrmR family transcriptional regulator
LNIMSLLPVREGQQDCTDIIQQLSGYLEEMRRLEENIFRI